MREKPRFAHDCDACKFLGHGLDGIHFGKPKPMDLYFCPLCEMPEGTLVGRYGNRGDQYASIPLTLWMQIKNQPIKLPDNTLGTMDGHWAWRAETLLIERRKRGAL